MALEHFDEHVESILNPLHFIWLLDIIESSLSLLKDTQFEVQNLTSNGLAGYQYLGRQFLKPKSSLIKFWAYPFCTAQLKFSTTTTFPRCTSTTATAQHSGLSVALLRLYSHGHGRLHFSSTYLSISTLSRLNSFSPIVFLLHSSTGFHRKEFCSEKKPKALCIRGFRWPSCYGESVVVVFSGTEREWLPSLC